MQPKKDTQKEHLAKLRALLKEFKVPETYELTQDLMEWKKDL